ncbi:MAG: L-seryl-tRNA(Sec) selenium transferase, partial [Deltaproteobacteria bacterium]|nr:L-seryl-tRNA(Sec) selenium transferase [Deltaproteobacteria bacterium]
PKTVLVQSSRWVVETLRSIILEGDQSVDKADFSDASILSSVKNKAGEIMSPNLTRTINATGVVVHTNLGRSLLASDAVENIVSIAGKYSNLEFNLASGTRGSRYDIVEELLCEISGAESAMVVNNNAGAVLLCLDTIAKEKKAIVSRGELVEIGGSFRIPDVMLKSGAILKEIGTTNRTHLKDYVNAIENDTGLLLKVHTSNYSLVGFTANVSLKELVGLGEKYHIPVMEDLGSGTFIDFSKYGLQKEPTVQESVDSGADVITFSGDKLLGGPQAGIIVGKKEFLDNIKKNPLTRALRIDKLTLAALESTLSLYRDPETAIHHIPTLNMLLCPLAQIQKKVKRLEKMLKNLNVQDMSISVVDLSSKAGGGSLPLLNLPSKGIEVTIQKMTANAIEKHMRSNMPPVIGRIENDAFIMDLRTVQDDELEMIASAIKDMNKNV